MKRSLSLFLILALMAALGSGCARAPITETQGSASSQAPQDTQPPQDTQTPDTQVPQDTQPPVAAPAPLAILETVWGGYSEEEQFPVMGGDVQTQLMGGPGAYDMELSDNLIYLLLVPEDRVPEIAEAATMIHMMNANSFTSGALRLKEGYSAESFANAMKERILGNQWICGFPDLLRIWVFGDDTVLVAYGVEDIMLPFGEKVTAAYEGQMTALVEERIG